MVLYSANSAHCYPSGWEQGYQPANYRLILNRDYELNRVRQQLAPELIAQIENWKEQKYSDSAKEYEVLYETININGKEVTGKLNVVAVSRFDAVFIVGQRHANDNFWFWWEGGGDESLKSADCANNPG